jgi:excisionase family DNA binding protein
MSSSPASDSARLLTVIEVAEQLHLSTRTIRRMITSREIKVVRLGRSVRVHPQALAELLDNRRQD